jgi:hypothetical protein
MEKRQTGPASPRTFAHTELTGVVTLLFDASHAMEPKFLVHHEETEPAETSRSRHLLRQTGMP